MVTLVWFYTNFLEKSLPELALFCWMDFEVGIPISHEMIHTITFFPRKARK